METFKLIRYIFYLILLMAGFSVQTFAQQITGTNIEYEEGDWISYTQSRYVNSIQVGRNTVFIATEGGILRYNFYTREWSFPFTMSNGLPDNNILAVAQDVATGHLWCSTPDAVCVYDPGSNLWKNYFLTEISPTDPVLSFGFDSRKVWLETRSGRLFSTPIHQIHFSSAKEEPDSTVIWYGVKGFKPVDLEKYFLPNAWMFIDDGYNYYIEDENFRRFRISYYIIDQWQELWAGTNGMGVFNGDTRLQEMYPLQYGLLNSDVRALYKKDDELWVGGIQSGSKVNGITHWNMKSNQWQYYEPSLISRFRSQEIYSIASTNQSVWFGTENGLTRYQPDKDRWRTYTIHDGLQESTIYSLAGADSILWVGTQDGLDYISTVPGRLDTLSITHVTKPQETVAVYDILLDDHFVWAGTEYGLFIYDRKKKEKGYYRGATGPRVETIMGVDKLRDSLWVATLHTVEVYDLKNKVWQGGPGRKIFNETTLTDLVASDGAIWIGSKNGLYKHSVKDGYWRQFTRQDGLLHPHVQKLLVDGDYLWIGSPYGLTHFYWNAPYRID